VPLSDIVRITISTESAQVTQAGFGVPLILAASQGFTDRIRYYNAASELLDDGFAPESGEYRMASVLMSQNPRPSRFAIGGRANVPTQRYSITVTVLNSHRYKLRVNGTDTWFDSGGTATQAEILAGLAAAITDVGAPVTAAVAGPAVTVTAAAPGDWFSLENTDVAALRVWQSHGDPGLIGDLTAIATIDSSWYAILNPFNSGSEIGAIATWAEANGKLFIAQSSDTASISLSSFDDAALGIPSAAQAMATANFARTAVVYHPSPGAFVDAGWAGRTLPLDPGSETWKFKSLAGVPAAGLNATQIANLKAKNANYYYTVGGVPITADGKVAANEWIDVVRGRDWLQARMSESIFGTLANAQKVPYTDAGITVIESVVRARLQDGVDRGLLAATPAPKTTVPRAANISSADKAARVLRNVQFDAVLAGAIHELELTGVISV
jgi:hypothetical protein